MAFFDRFSTHSPLSKNGRHYMFILHGESSLEILKRSLNYSTSFKAEKIRRDY